MVGVEMDAGKLFARGFEFTVSKFGNDWVVTDEGGPPPNH
jgi:hypothetical protein